MAVSDNERKASAGKPAIDASFINAFCEATLHVLSTMAQTKAVKESVFLRKGDQISGDISAVIAMNSSTFRGSMAIAFDSVGFLSVASRMLMETCTEINPDVADACGELCNQIFGVSKQKLSVIGHDLQKALPSIVTGKNHTIKHCVLGPCIAIRFNLNPGVLIVEASLQSTD